MATDPTVMLPTIILAAVTAIAAPAAAQQQAAQQQPAQQQLVTGWPIFRGNAALQGVATGELGAAPELAWKFKTGGAITSSPVIDNGTVYVGSSDEHVYAIDLVSGQQKWSFKTDDFVEAPPLVHDGRVYFGSNDFFFYALDAVTGAELWKYETGEKIMGSANVVALRSGATGIVVGSYDNNLYCFDAASGAVIWSYETGNYVNGTPAVLGDKIVFGGCDAILHVVSAATGEKVDQVVLGGDCHVAGSVALAANRVYFGHYGNEFICIDLDQGELVWRYPNDRHPFFSSPAIADGVVVFGGRDKKLHCVKRGDGAPLWTFATRRKIDGSPVICGDKVVFGSGDGRLYLLALEDGAELWQYEVGQSVFSSPAVAGGWIVVGSNDGVLYAFRA